MFAKTMPERNEEGCKEMQFHFRSDTRRKKQITLIKDTEKDNIFSLLLIEVMFNVRDHVTKNDDDNNNCKWIICFYCQEISNYLALLLN